MSHWDQGDHETQVECAEVRIQLPNGQNDVHMLYYRNDDMFFLTVAEEKQRIFKTTGIAGPENYIWVLIDKKSGQELILPEEGRVQKYERQLTNYGEILTRPR